VHILVATDADYVVNDVTSALSGPDVRFTICSEGREVSRLVGLADVDLVILDLQIGSKGGMAVAMDLRLDESDGRIPAVKVLMLLDRMADVHLAKRSAADVWLVKPTDPLTLKRTVRDLLHPPAPALATESLEDTPDGAPDVSAAETAEEDTVAAG
jgi:two-component system nitrate/nitrite response regulator NarL